MSIFKKNGVNELGIEYSVIEEITIYKVLNYTQEQQLVDKLNKQYGSEKFHVTDEPYPKEIVIDAYDFFD